MRLGAWLIPLALLAPAAAAAEGIDCSRARAPLDRAICASPALLALDSRLAESFAAALASAPDPAALRATQRQWLQDRARACVASLGPAALARCLTQQGTARLAALPQSPPAVPAAAPAPPPAAPDMSTDLVQAAAPAIPDIVPAATLDDQRLPADRPGETLLHVTAPGRFSIAVRSAGGAALQLVDMATGPTELAGAPGAQDGRLDLLLDVGTYKLRLTPADGATGEMTLHATPFRPVGAPQAVPQQGHIDASLADGEQRSFWLTVSADQPVRIEAAGRALADLRLWRNGTELASLTPDGRDITPSPGHPLTDLRLQGKLPPGTYRVTAYGGPAQVWADNAPDQPFHLRSGLSPTLQPGWVQTQIGPFGSELYVSAPFDDLFRLGSADPATLIVDGQQLAIERNSRVPSVSLRASSQAAPHLVEVQGQAGQAVTLRAARLGEVQRITAPGTDWITANATGFGGDAPPATLLLARRVRDRLDVITSRAPQIGPGAWRARFNLGGPVSLLFHAAGGPVVAQAAGVPIGPWNLLALDSATLVPNTSPNRWELPAGWYVLRLAPVQATGIIELTLGPPGVTAVAQAPQPVDPSFAVGRQSVTAGAPLVLFGNVAPGAAIALDARSLPVALAEAPLRAMQPAGHALEVPVAVPDGGVVQAMEVDAGAIAVAVDGGVAHVSASDRDRLITLYLQPNVHPAPIAPPTAAPQEMLTPGTPRFFDLAEGATRSFGLELPEGGLTRIETLGRLHTLGHVGSDFAPSLQDADANGAGWNMRLQTWLHAGRFHIDVTAKDSSGHLGLRAAPAPVQTLPVLRPLGRLHASLQPGTGAVLPIEIATAGRYRLELIGQGRPFQARLEDGDGWPLAVAGPMDILEQAFRPGRLRLMLLPPDTASGLLVRLLPVPPPAAHLGHGPFDLPFDQPQSATWREPDATGTARDPDVWTFTLNAPATVDLTIGADMAATLHRGDAVVGRLTGDTPLQTTLPAGDYRLEAAALGRNDRLDYTVTLASTELQPDSPRSLTLPTRQSFALATERVVTLTSVGPAPVRAVLRDAAGHVRGRFGPGEDDWNLHVSRRLPAGRYTLDLASAAPPAGADVPSNPNDAAASDTDAPDADADASEGQTQTSTLPGAAASSDSDAPAAPATAAADSPQTEVTLSLPPDRSPVAVAAAMTLAGGGVHVVDLPTPNAGQLLLLQAGGEGTLHLGLQRRQGDAWQDVAQAEGRRALLAVPAEGGEAWRLSLWPIDGGTLPMTLGFRLLDPTGFGAMLTPAGMDGLTAAHVTLAQPDLLRLGAPDQRLLVAGWPGHPATPAQAGLVLPQDRSLWLVGIEPGPVTLAPVPPAPIAVSLAPGEVAALPATGLTAWIAASSEGQAWLDAGRGMSVASGSSMALADSQALLMRNAGTAPLRLALRPLPLAPGAPRPFDGRFAGILPPGGALALQLPEGQRDLRLDLAPGTAGIGGWHSAQAVTAWAGEVALSRELTAPDADLLLVNGTDRDAPVTVSVVAPLPRPLDATHPVKRSFPSAGSLDLALLASPGQRLRLAGNADATVLSGGRVLHGMPLTLPGSGRVVIRHGAGLLAAWLEGDGATPWPAVDPLPVTPPQTVSLAGAAMRLDLGAAAPTLLRVQGSTPVILSWHGRTRLFAAGADLATYLPAGAASLDVISPLDAPLSGTLRVTRSPLLPATEGLGSPIALPPGGLALFDIAVSRHGRIGLGVQADPDDATARLLRADGRELARGVAMLRDLDPGHYVLEIRLPAAGPAATVRPAVIGLTPPTGGPPPDVVRHYLELVGIAPEGPPP